MNSLQYTAVSSFIQPSFWNKFTELKINVDKLEEKERKIWGYFANSATTWNHHVLEVDSTSFNLCFNKQNNNVPFYGQFFNKNTVEQFKDCDKTQLINEIGKAFLEDLNQDLILETPSMLNLFFILSYGDLKKYQFYYWFAFPVPHSLQILSKTPVSINDQFSNEAIQSLSQEYQSLHPDQRAYFLIHQNKVFTLKSKLKEITEENYREYYFAFSDFLNARKAPKPQLKNFLVLIHHYCPFLEGKNTNFLLLYLDPKLSIGKSEIFELQFPEVSPIVSWVGWEKNEKNKFGPRFSNMKATMNPQTLYEESVDLNLKLMKWRLLPDVDLDVVKNAKCLLLGSGTLGCSVARNLLGWGVRNITFVDNSKVSYSNPVRQHLYEFQDAILNKPKALAAADSLKRIFPSINTQGFQITIPMPGHTTSESTLSSVKESIASLRDLIQTHDVIFLLTDSRESRWLPTLLGVCAQKIIINVALGFDTYLIMRYGRSEGVTPAASDKGRIQGVDLGCYFCNDVTTPGNSLKDRSLDQQCTVTRPGVSSIAGALAVELLVSVLQSPLGVNTPAFYQMKNTEFEPDQGILGIVPHSIRGFLSSFSHIMPATPKFTQCIACSDVVVDEYKTRDFEFLVEVFNSLGYLEKLTGLSQLFEEDNFIEVLEIGEEEDWDS